MSSTRLSNHLVLLTVLALLLLGLLLPVHAHSAAKNERDNDDATAESPAAATSEKNETCSALEASVRACQDARCIARAIGTPGTDDDNALSTFAKTYWEKEPLLLHSDPTALGDALLSWDDVVDMATAGTGLKWSLGGGNAVLTPGARNGSTPNFVLDDSRKGSPMTRQSIESAAVDSTLFIGSAHALHPGVANFTIEMQRALGMVAGTNVFVTRPSFDVAEPLHTDRLDTFVVQTSGSKRWKVYRPLKAAERPVWGVHGDAQWGRGEVPGGIPPSAMGDLVVDTILRPGDILYVPRGFPHATSTAHTVSGVPSVSLSVLMHTEGSHLVYEKLVRCAMTKVGLLHGKKKQGDGSYDNLGIRLIRRARSEEGAALREALPIGFLQPTSGSDGKDGFKDMVLDVALPHVRAVLEGWDYSNQQRRGNNDDGKNGNVEQDLERTKKELERLAEIVYNTVRHDTSMFEMAAAGSSFDSPYKYEDRQRAWQGLFGKSGPFQGNVCHADGPRALFSDYFSEDLEPDYFTLLLHSPKRSTGSTSGSRWDLHT